MTSNTAPMPVWLLRFMVVLASGAHLPAIGEAATFAVTNVSDAGPGSLRQAILDANNSPGIDTIIFDIPGPAPHTIQPLSVLPPINDPVVIDGTSEPDFAGTPIIEIDGSNLGATASGLWLRGGSTVRALVVNRWGFTGLSLGGGGNVLEGNYVGTDVSGTVSLGNRFGVVVHTSSDDTIGGTTPAARNVISGNASYDVQIARGTNTVVQGNYIGTDVSGTAALPGAANGIRVQNSAGGLIGGTAAGAGNVISGHRSAGVIIFSSSANYQVQGNYVGTDASGTIALGNSRNGVLVSSSTNITIGGTAAGAGNLISGNNGYGVSITGPAARVEGNIIGADVSGTVPLGNINSGVWAGSNTTIGGQTSGAGNLIAYNGQSGLRVSGTSNAIWSNRIYANGSLGIALGLVGVTPNDDGDADTGPNNLQNYPVLTAVTAGSIAGSLDSTPNTTFRIEFYSNSGCDPLGYGEGEVYLGAMGVTTDGSGHASFSASLSVSSSQFVTATATDPDNNTSEFSACFQAPANQPPAADAGPDQILECDSHAGASVQLDGSGSSDPDGDPLDFSWSAPGIVFDDASNVTPTAVFPLGTTTVILTVTDPSGEEDIDDVGVTVEDTTPPTVSVTTSPASLWPPNHKYELISVSVSVSDACDASPAVSASAVSDEPDDAKGNGDGRTTGDIRVTMDGGRVSLSSNAVPEVVFDPQADDLELRAERGGGNSGRTYAITVRATDASGNATTAASAVVVGHDRGAGKPLALAETPSEYALRPNVPNPFNPETTIRYELPQSEMVNLSIYDTLGRQVLTLMEGHVGAGSHQAVWRGMDDRGHSVGSGVYFARLVAGDFTAVQRMLLLR